MQPQFAEMDITAASIGWKKFYLLSQAVMELQEIKRFCSAVVA